MSALEIRSLTKTYHLYDSPLERLREALDPRRRPRGRAFHALKDVTFDVGRGEVVGVIGRNGSGKSTLLKIIAGAMSPTSGEVAVNGRVSALLELGSAFNPELTGRENVFFSGMLHGLSRGEMEERFEAIERFADIGEFIDQPVKSYSSGMFVRLAFSVSVCIEPEILIVDEALSVGDMAFQQKCLDRLQEMRKRGVTILLVTHDILLTRAYCDRVIYLKNGKIVSIGDPERVGELYIADVKSEIQHVDTSIIQTSRGESLQFGSKDGQITKIIVKNNETGLPLVTEGGSVDVEVEGIISSKIRYPRFIIQFRDHRGYPIYGIHSSLHELVFKPINNKIIVSATLRVSVALSQGKYSVIVSLNNYVDNNQNIIIDKVVGAAELKVIQQDKIKNYHGVVDLGGKWIQKEGCVDKLLIGCVADVKQKYIDQALRLVKSIRWFGGSLSKTDIMVCFVGHAPRDIIEKFENFDVIVKIVEAYDLRSPVTNKLRLVEQPEIHNYSKLLMLDCDTIVVSDPIVPISSSLFRAKPADDPTMDDDDLRRVFKFFNMDYPEKEFYCTVHRAKTIAYFNTGVLMFPSTTFNSLVPSWINWTKRLMSNFEILEGKAHFIEQTSLSLAIAETNTHFMVFGNEMNCPIHHDDYNECLENVFPIIIHYHSMVDSEGYILPSKYSSINDKIGKFNRKLKEDKMLQDGVDRLLSGDP